MIQTIKDKTTYTVKLEQKGKTDFNIWAYIYKPTDKMPIAGTCFNKSAKAEEIKNWAVATINNFNQHYNKIP